MQFTFLEVYGGLQCKNWSKNEKNAAAAADDDDDIFSNSWNYLQDFDQSKLLINNYNHEERVRTSGIVVRPSVQKRKK